MNNEAYVKQTHEKIRTAVELYAPYLFKTVSFAENVLALETSEHLRKPPKAVDMRPIAPGTKWGKEFGSLWLSTSFTVPEALEGQQLCVIPEANAVEILCFKNGVPAGIINSKNKFIGGDHSVMFLYPAAQAGETIQLSFECYAGHDCLGAYTTEEYYRDEPNPADFVHTYDGIRFAVLDTVIRDFIFDTLTVLDLAELPEDNFVSMSAHRYLMEAFPWLIQDVRQASEEDLRASASKVSQILAPTLKKGPGELSRGRVGVVGHSHLDTAWLWTLEETIRKAARTYSQALLLMDLYPDYTFMQSSVLHLDWMRRYYPEIFAGIQQKIAEGRYEVNGCVWVECDCNITCGESLIRQFLYGIRYCIQYLNYKPDVFWLADTFGYSAAIPQIMQGFGIKYFYTAKLTWNDLNKFPATSFIWRGIDGSEVLSHMNRIQLMPNVKDLTRLIDKIRSKRTCDMRLAAYGFGDGGGGPTFGMLEYLKRVQGLDGMPQIQTTTTSKFMQQLEQEQEHLPVYDGELYLECHRGTLTQMHDIKKQERIAEIAMHDMELLNVLSGAPVNENTHEMYKVLMKNQFHDLLPGTSIPRVNQTTISELCQLSEQLQAQTGKYLSAMTRPAAEFVSLYNTLSFDRNDVVVLEGVHSFEGRPCQVYEDWNGNTKTAVQVFIPAMDTCLLTPGPAPVSSSPFIMTDNELITPYYRVTFDSNGYISSLTDLEADRKVHREGGHPLGTFWFGEEMPQLWDNWDIDSDAFAKLRPVTDPISREIISDGCVEYRIRAKYRIGRKSKLTADVVFFAHSRRIDFETQVEWDERHALLKVGFDVNIRAFTVKNEVQFGHVDRPTTRNNPQEDGKFEVCNHKWSDLSETHYGVALLNDCKYGLSVEGSHMRLTLHRGGCRPDPATDHGTHTMTYSLLPHIGGFDAKTVIHPAYALNYRPLLTEGILSVPKLFALSAPGIICEAVKHAEDIPSGYALRLYESERNTTNCRLLLHEAKRVWSGNMLEEKVEELPIQNGEVSLTFRPFEIKTILVER